MTSHDDCDVVVIGGGFYGLRIARMLASLGARTRLFEKAAFAQRASLNNQARVHGGYHYPRSVLTAQRSREHYSRFVRDFQPAIDSSFRHVYAIARHQTKVGASEFVGICRRIGAPVAPAPRELARQLDMNLIEDAFTVEEAVFDARVLTDQALHEARDAGARCDDATSVVAVEPGGSMRLAVRMAQGSVGANWVVNATYSNLNDVLEASAVAVIPLIHELTEIAVVNVPPSMDGFGITVVDGPFWSCLPFPAFGAWSLTHVRYTPHLRWASGEADPRENAPPDSHFPLMQRDAARFLPAMRQAVHVASRWETKTVLPRSTRDDSRPILAHAHADAPGLVSVLGAKIDSVYDVEDELRDMISASIP